MILEQYKAAHAAVAFRREHRGLFQSGVTPR